MRKLIQFFFPVLLFFPVASIAQEFNVSVQVYANQVEGTERKIYETLQQELYDFVNNRNWTNYQYKPEERIEGSILINVSQRSGDQFQSTLTVALRRPVFRTAYNSALINYQDRDFEFRYTEYQPLDYADNVFNSNLTSTIAYYLYIMLGYDADSFSRHGGTPYFQKANSVVNIAQNAAERGWKAFESQKNRYWMVENLMNPAYASLRDAMYTYHRMGLDRMSEDMDLARLSVYESLEMLRKAHRERPGLFLVQLFLDAKREEIINIYAQASPMDKTQTANILKEIDPSNSNRYQEMITTR